MNPLRLVLTIHAVGPDYRGIFSSLYEAIEPWCKITEVTETRGHDYVFRALGDVAYGASITAALVAHAKLIAPAGHSVSLTAEWNE